MSNADLIDRLKSMAKNQGEDYIWRVCEEAATALEAAEGDRDRLREALESISDNWTTGWAEDLERHEIIRKVERIAKAALTQEQPDKEQDRS